MLQSLRVTDFLLVAEATLEFNGRMAVLTGETGTGKSILLSALGLLLGARGSAQLVRPGAARLRLEAVFVADAHVRAMLREMGVPRGGQTAIVTREIDRRGRSRCFVNGQRVLVATVRRLGAQLVEVHGQRQEERFRRPEVQRDLLDLFGGHQRLRREVREAYHALRRARDVWQAHRERIARLVSEEDWLRFQVAEIAAVDPQAGEAERLREQVRAGRAAADRAQLLELAERLLNGREGAVLEALEELDHALTDSAAWSEEWCAFRETVGALRRQARETYRTLGRLRGDDEAGDRALAEWEARLRQLEHLQRKHRRTLDEIVALAAEMQSALDELASGREREAQLSAELADREGALRRAAAELRQARQRTAPRMMRALERELRALGMPEVQLRMAFPEREAQGAETIGPQGSERVVCEIETNPGEGFRALGEIASGGEMSRVALAIRVALGSAGRNRLTVFDEVDAGLGGAAAKAVAKRLAQVAKHRQVLLVTHLPIIAAAADQQFRVTKERRGGRNVAGVERLDGEARIAEIARMLSGDAADAQAREHARGLLGGAT